MSKLRFGRTAMPFQYSCFISHRNHDQNALADRFIDDLCDALRNELSMMTDADIFVDRKGMRGGQFIDPTLSHALCMSACMVVVYTPVYFDLKKTYCAREYRAMEALETERLKRVATPLAKQSGLIFPIILRGSLPNEIHQKRHFFDFKQFSLIQRAISKNPKFEPAIRSLAEEICNRIEMLKAGDQDFTCDCEKFQFPTDAEIQPWLSGITAPAPAFPNRAT
jgi:hypothetical protein